MLGETVFPTIYQTASNMHNFPPHRYIEGFLKTGEYDHDSLITILNQLTIENSYTLIFSNKIETGLVINE